MAKLILQFKDKIINEYQMSGDVIRIGRNPDNEIAIQNAAVSKYHAKVTLEESKYILTDLKSTNGTFVNGRKANQLELRNGDNIVIGKHTIVFKSEKKSGEDSLFADFGGATMVLDTKQQKDLLSSQKNIKLKQETDKVAKLIIYQSGNRREFDLTKEVTLIGKSSSCDVQIDGFLIPPIAATIKKEENDYFISSYGGWINVTVNGKQIGENLRLYKNSVIQIRKTKMVFKQ